MKEFTVHPKKPDKDDSELLLTLKEDGSFQQCSNQDDDDNDDNEPKDIDASWNKFQKVIAPDQFLQSQLLQGTWDFIDGKLILAADRLEPTASDDLRRKTLENRRKGLVLRTKDDTLLVGRVVANYDTKLKDNPVLSQATDDEGDQTTKKESKDESAQSSVSLDTHLSVPKGSVKVGRFFYPRRHPSFFEQPMFQPKKRGFFSLRQVLGALNTELDREEEQQERFHCSDFYNKTFSLTSHPIGYKPKGKLRWSIRQNKMVRDPPKAAAKAAEDSRPANIRVMQVQFHANNTFSTVAGLGESILRGKFDIIGKAGDQLWMQVWRFGFGRSVSGSVYSEGRMLTHEDAKTYWGEIRHEGQHGGSENDPAESPAVGSEESANRLEVKGSVMFGWGIEPTPEARFIMREVTDADVLSDEEEDEDEDGNVLDDDIPPSLGSDGIDWANEDDSSFQ